MPDRSEQTADALGLDLRDHKRMRDVSDVFYRVERLSPGARSAPTSAPATPRASCARRGP